MACCPTEKSDDYESCRFVKDIDENFHCSICYYVLKEPRMCRNNDHMFCFDCITEHLAVNSQTCPECNEHLSVGTLRRPRVVNNYISELKINCDYASRGCSESVRVADLETHVDNCCFAPVLCSNEECGMEINKQDKVHHESKVCEYRKVKWHECEEVQDVLGILKENIVELDIKLEATRRETNNDEKEMQIEVKGVKENLSKVNKDADEVKVMMTQILGKLNMLELLSKLPSPTEGMINTPREDILITGGSGRSKNFEQSTEIYSWEKNGWFEVSEMNEKHEGASSFICKGQLFVIGGYHSRTIETLDLNKLPLKWIKFHGKCSYACDDCQIVVYQQRIIHIGGWNYDANNLSNVISELQLTSPCTMNKLCEMPEPRQCHGAEILEDKVLIMGGENRNYFGALDSVLEFDVSRNKCKEMPPLPHALKQMATVRWRDKVVVLGGQKDNINVLNDVFMYDCRTGKVTTLPSMLEKRSRCSAVITGNTIVVMGGFDEKFKDLDTVECFAMGGYTWEYLPAMNKARWRATTHVLPSTKKYV